MVAATERQSIPLVDPLDLVVTSIVIQLDAALASRAVTRPSMAFLPEAEHWQLVDLAIRQWATLRKGTITDWKQETCQGYTVSVADRRVVDVHRPQPCWLVEPRPAPRVLIDADTSWSPASNVTTGNDGALLCDCASCRKRDPNRGEAFP